MTPIQNEDDERRKALLGEMDDGPAPPYDQNAPPSSLSGALPPSPTSAPATGASGGAMLPPSPTLAPSPTTRPTTSPLALAPKGTGTSAVDRGLAAGGSTGTVASGTTPEYDALIERLRKQYPGDPRPGSPEERAAANGGIDPLTGFTLPGYVKPGTPAPAPPAPAPAPAPAPVAPYDPNKPPTSLNPTIAAQIPAAPPTPIDTGGVMMPAPAPAPAPPPAAPTAPAPGTTTAAYEELMKKLRAQYPGDPRPGTPEERAKANGGTDPLTGFTLPPAPTAPAPAAPSAPQAPAGPTGTTAKYDALMEQLKKQFPGDPRPGTPEQRAAANGGTDPLTGFTLRGGTTPTHAVGGGSGNPTVTPPTRPVASPPLTPAPPPAPGPPPTPAPTPVAPYNPANPPTSLTPGAPTAPAAPVTPPGPAQVVPPPTGPKSPALDALRPTTGPAYTTGPVTGPLSPVASPQTGAPEAWQPAPPTGPKGIGAKLKESFAGGTMTGGTVTADTPGHGEPVEGYDVDQATRAALLDLMQSLGQPVSIDDPNLKGQADAYQRQRNRGAGREREQAAERAAFMGLNAGGQGSGAFETQIQGIQEGASEDTADYNANLVGQEMQHRRSSLLNALGIAEAVGARAEGNEIRQALAALDAQMYREGLAQNGDQFWANLDEQQLQWDDTQGFNWAALIAQLNRDAYLGNMG